MPVSYSIDATLGVIFLEASDLVRDEDLLGTVKGFSSDPHFSKDLRLLGDFTGITVNRMSSSGMSRCAQLNPFGEHSRRAILVKGPAEFGMFRVYEAYCSLNNKSAPHIFQGREAAIEFLNKDVPPSRHLSLEDSGTSSPGNSSTQRAQNSAAVLANEGKHAWTGQFYGGERT